MPYKTIIDKQPLILNTNTSNVNMKITGFILCRKSEKPDPFWVVPVHTNNIPTPLFTNDMPLDGKNIETPPQWGYDSLTNK
jgi:hypothetical protein